MIYLYSTPVYEEKRQQIRIFNNILKYQNVYYILPKNS